MGTVISIIFGIFVLAILFYILKKIFPLIIGGGILVGVGFGLFNLPWGSLGNIVMQIIYSVFICIGLFFVGAILAVILKKLKIRWSMVPALLFLVLVNMKTNAIQSSPILISLALILSIGLYFWSIFKFKFIKKHIGFSEELDSNIICFYSGMFMSLGCIYLYLIKFPNTIFGTSYTTDLYLYALVYIGLLVSLSSLHSQIKMFKEVQRYLDANGMCTFKGILESISVECEEKNTFVKQVLLKMKQNKEIVEVASKTVELYVKSSIYDEILSQLKSGRSQREIAVDVSEIFNVDVHPKVVSFVLNNSFVGRRVKRDSINSEFMILRHDIHNHPILNAGKQYQVYYFILMRYLLQDVEKVSSSITALLKKYAVDLNIKEDCKLDSNSVQRGMKKICSNEIQFKWFDFSVRNYKVLLLLECFYFRSIIKSQIEYELLEKYCQQLKIAGELKKEVLRIVETFLLPPADIEIALQKCTDKHVLRAGLYLQEKLKKNCMYESLPRYNVAVCATMSSGKSTFINALLGNDYIPSRNEACTAKITSIADNDHLNSILGGVIQKDGQAVFQPNISRTMLEEWNNNNDVERVLLEGDLKEIKSEKGVLVIHDTPGTNYSQDQEHHDQTMRFLKNNEINLIIYLVNAEHASTTDNRILLQQIKEEVILQKSADIIFLVNKLDSYDIEKQDDVTACLNGVKKELVDLGYENPVVLPIVANAARLFKMVLTGQELTKKEASEFRNLYELFVEDRFNLFEFAKKEISIEAPTIEETDETIKIKDTSYSKKSILEALQMTGITVVESLLDREINLGRIN